MKQGDRGAFSTLYLRHRDAVYTYCLHLQVGENEAQDTVHEAFVRIHDKLDSLTDGSAFRAWALSIARNLVLNGRRNIHVEYGHDEDPASPDGDPFESMVREEISAAVRRGIKKLNPLLREALQLRLVQELSYKDIATVTEVTEDVVRIRLYRARKALVQLLRPFGEKET
ncbi:MAG: polymerase, sigma-24 subunit, subfamily [Bacteroidetes bacterium]|nr:polymerase, sigma-24 subunit, subfamily [Bacteroidota bacterium]